MAKSDWKKQAEESAIPEINTIEPLVKFETNDGDGILTINQLIDEKVALDEQKKVAEERLKWLGEQLTLALATSGVEKVRIRDGMVLKIGYGKSPSKIEPTLLLQNGVTVEQIQASTVQGKAYSFAQIVKPKASAEKEG